MINKLIDSLRGYHYDNMGFIVRDNTSISYRIHQVIKKAKSGYVYYCISKFLQMGIYPLIARIKIGIFTPKSHTLPLERLTSEIQRLEILLDAFIEHKNDPWDYRLCYNDLLFLFRLLKMHYCDDVSNEHVLKIVEKCINHLFVKEYVDQERNKKGLKETVDYIHSRLLDTMPQHVLGVIYDYRLFIRMAEKCNEILLYPAEAPKPSLKWSEQAYRETLLLNKPQIKPNEFPEFVSCLENFINNEGWQAQFNKIIRNNNRKGWPRIFVENQPVISPHSLFIQLTHYSFLDARTLRGIVKMINKYGGIQDTYQACQLGKLTLAELVTLKKFIILNAKFNDCFHQTYSSENENAFLGILKFAKTYTIPDVMMTAPIRYVKLMDRFGDFAKIETWKFEDQKEYLKFISKNKYEIERINNFNEITYDLNYPDKLNLFINSPFRSVISRINPRSNYRQINLNFRHFFEKIEYILLQINCGNIDKIEKEHKLTLAEYYFLLDFPKSIFPYTEKNTAQRLEFLNAISRTRRDKSGQLVLTFDNPVPRVRSAQNDKGFVKTKLLVAFNKIFLRYHHTDIKFYRSTHSMLAGFGNIGPFVREVHSGKSLHSEEFKLRPFKFVKNFDLSRKKEFNQIFKSKLTNVINEFSINFNSFPLPSPENDTRLQNTEDCIQDIMKGKVPSRKITLLSEVDFEPKLICSQFVLTSVIIALLKTCEELNIPPPKDMRDMGFNPWLHPRQISPAKMYETWKKMGALAETDKKEPYSLKTFIDY